MLRLLAWQLHCHIPNPVVFYKLHSLATVAAQAALETLPKDAKGKLLVKPEIRSDKGSCYISREFGGVLDEHELSHRRIRSHCPEENGLMERANRLRLRQPTLPLTSEEAVA